MSVSYRPDIARVVPGESSREGMKREQSPSRPDKAIRSAAAKERQDLIGRELRRMYKDLVNEPLPDSFQELLREIDKDKEQDDDGGAGGH